MKYRGHLGLFTFLFVFTCLFSNCKKGDAGPAGDRGPTGPQGPKGDTGTANVIYSAWLDVVFLPDTILTGTVVDTIGYYADVTAAKLTSAILSSGEMKIYMNSGTAATPDVFALPYFDTYTGIHVTPEFMLQRIHLYSNVNVSTTTISGSKRLQYRYILIPGSVNGRMAHSIDWKDYNKVRDYLQIKD